MVSRLYASTRSLWEQVEQAIAVLDVGRGRPRRVVEVMALYVTGLILLEKGQTAVRIATVLPGRAHDALNRLLRVLPWSPQHLILGLIRWVECQTGPGYLCLDDVVVEKPFAKVLTWAGWTYSHSEKRHVFGFHIVLLFWCNKMLRIPVGFALWRPKRDGKAFYRTKLELAQGLISNVLRARLTFEYLTFDLWYNARSFTKWLDDQKVVWVSTLKSNALITYRGRTQPVAEWAAQLPRHRVAGRTWAWIGTVHLPRYGNVRLVVATNGQGGLDYIVSNDLHRRGKVLIARKRSRWDIETSFRDTKQLAGLGACQCRVSQAMERHVALVLLAFVVLQQLRLAPSETVGEVKRRLHLTVIRGDQSTSGGAIASPREGEIMAAA
jgi:DDE superfamily endonuclease